MILRPMYVLLQHARGPWHGSDATAPLRFHEQYSDVLSVLIQEGVVLFENALVKYSFRFVFVAGEQRRHWERNLMARLLGLQRVTRAKRARLGTVVAYFSYGNLRSFRPPANLLELKQQVARGKDSRGPFDLQRHHPILGSDTVELPRKVALDGADETIQRGGDARAGMNAKALGRQPLRKLGHGLLFKLQPGGKDAVQIFTTKNSRARSAND
jgi:hypothetical protein